MVAISNSGAVKVWTLTGSENMVGISTVIIHLYTTAWKPVGGTQVDFYITWSSLRFVISWSNDILSFNALITEINGHIVKGKDFLACDNYLPDFLANSAHWYFTMTWRQKKFNSVEIYWIAHGNKLSWISSQDSKRKFKINLLFICISDTASLWKRVQADPLFECADFNLLSLQSENCPDSLLQVLAGEFPQCTATVSIYMYLHCITTFLFNVKKIIFCLIWSLWKSHFYAEFNFTFIYVKIPT